MKITNDIKYVGVNDTNTDLFEGQYVIPNGISYNSYVIIDEKIAVMDSVEANFADEWIDNIRKVTGGRCPDYIIVQHMEPDHSSSIAHFASEFPTATVVSSAKAFAMMKNYFGTDFSDRQVVVGDQKTLCLGKRELCFFLPTSTFPPASIITAATFLR